ncbi:MAG: RtcB family protein, partial [Nanoarchaeales archaeon]
MNWKNKIKRISEVEWEIEKGVKPNMNVPVRLFLSEKLLNEVEEGAIEQAINVATLPGIYKYSIAMPDMHFGYGFCLLKDSKVHLSFGTYLTIDKIKENQKILVFNFRDKVLEESKVIRFFCLNPYTKIRKLKTKFGFEIKTTLDHPILTLSGFKMSKDINIGDKVFVKPFEGVEYEEPSNEIILSEEDLFKKMKELGFSEKRIKLNLEKLKKRNLVPLRYSSEKLPYLLKLMGFIFGDGCMNFIGRKKDGIIIFSSSEKENLEQIRKDVIAINYNPSKIYKLKRKKYTYYVFYVNAASLVCLLYALGVPIGKKSEKDFDVPEWIFNCKLWQIRLFLSAFFGAELSIPRKRKDRNLFLPLLLQQNRKNLESGIKFLSSIAKLLSLFGIESLIKVRKKRKDSFEIELRISSKVNNLIKFFKHISYEYNSKRRLLANISLLYLLYYKKLLEEKIKKIELIKNLENLASSEISEKTNLKLRYVQYIKNKNRNNLLQKLSVKIKKNEIMSFENFVKSLKMISTDIFLDEIIEIEDFECEENVYDITVESEFHNFVANGIIVSNCIGGVAAIDYYDGVISPGGIGFDINCGVRALRTNLMYEDIKDKLRELVDAIFRNVPSGVGSEGVVKLTSQQTYEVLKCGAKWAVENGYGWEKDLEFIEDNGNLEKYAMPEYVSQKAIQRGMPQLGTLGSGNHFLEIQVVDKIFDYEIAKILGIEKENQIIVFIHTGSRGLGHQVASDYLEIMEREFRDLIRKLPDRQLAYAPSGTKTFERYFGAMNAAANYAFANR